MEKKREKEILNIVIANNSEAREYINYLNLYFNINVLDRTKISSTKDVDLVLFTGGEDVDPQYYNEKPGQYTRFNKKRDDLEADVFYQFINRPKLGICRGAQFLTTLAKGKLIQHVEGHHGEHMIEIYNYGNYRIPSTHHQMMFPFNLPKDDYNLKAWSSNFLSTTYLNGGNEEIKLPNDFLEPEIVEYLRTKSLCIQGHPELGNDDIKNVTLQLISQFLKKFKPKYQEDEVYVDSIPAPKLGSKWINSGFPSSFSAETLRFGTQAVYGTKSSSVGVKSTIERMSTQDIDHRFNPHPMNTAAEAQFEKAIRESYFRGSLDSVTKRNSITSIKSSSIDDIDDWLMGDDEDQDAKEL